MHLDPGQGRQRFLTYNSTSTSRKRHISEEQCHCGPQI